MTSIKLVVFDADDVIFSSSSDCYIGQVKLPVRRLDADTVEDAVGRKIRLDKEARPVLQELRKRGIHVSLDSINKPREAGEVIRILELDKVFEHAKINFSDKGANMLKIIQEFKDVDKLEISFDEVMFIDDVEEFCLNVKRTLKGKGVILQMNRDILHLSELLTYL
jgi:magnesium-dependent phosphatase-1